MTPAQTRIAEAGEKEAAFPQPYEHAAPGMTLRDWFAGQALAGIGEWMPPADYGPFNWDSRGDVCALKARWAYAQADAMLAARSSTGGSDAA